MLLCNLVRASVRREYDSAVAVRAENVDACIFKLRHRFLVRMAVIIALSAGNEYFLGSDCISGGRRRACAAAVMADLEDITLQTKAALEDGRLFFLLCVPCKEHGEISVCQLSYDGIIIEIRAALLVRDFTDRSCYVEINAVKESNRFAGPSEYGTGCSLS